VTSRDESAHGQIRDSLDSAVQSRRHRNVRIDGHGNSKAHRDADVMP